MSIEWVPCPHPHTGGAVGKCRFCRGMLCSSSPLRDACVCDLPIHQDCLIEEINWMKSENLAKMKTFLEKENHEIYYCRNCNNPVMFPTDFSPKSVPLRQLVATERHIFYAIFFIVVLYSLMTIGLCVLAFFSDFILLIIVPLMIPLVVLMARQLKSYKKVIFYKPLRPYIREIYQKFDDESKYKQLLNDHS